MFWRQSKAKKTRQSEERRRKEKKEGEKKNSTMSYCNGPIFQCIVEV